MMKITTTILIFFTLQLFGQSSETLELKKSFEKLQQADNKENQRNYFNLFPDNFNSFEQTFGYFNEKPTPLYDDSYDYIIKFYSLDKISKRDKFEKWINISFGGKWDADAVNYFQHELRPRILRNIGLTYSILKNKTDNQTESFFYFFFQETHPQYDTIPTEFDEIRNTDKEFYNLLTIGHKRAINDSGH